jgi:hypothetical protein
MGMPQMPSSPAPMGGARFPGTGASVSRNLPPSMVGEPGWTRRWLAGLRLARRRWELQRRLKRLQSGGTAAGDQSQTRVAPCHAGSQGLRDVLHAEGRQSADGHAVDQTSFAWTVGCPLVRNHDYVPSASAQLQFKSRSVRARPARRCRSVRNLTIRWYKSAQSYESTRNLLEINFALAP